MFHFCSVVGVLSAFYGVTGKRGFGNVLILVWLGLRRLCSHLSPLFADRLLEVSAAAQAGNEAGMKTAYDKLLHWHEGVACT
jgi:hypothetical protein